MASLVSLAQLLIQHGFIKPEFRRFYKKDEKKGLWVLADPDNTKSTDEHADQEYAEEANIGAGNQYIGTSYPSPHKRYKVIYESYNLSHEESYYWVLNFLRQDIAYPAIDKITDVFSASENSAFFGQSAQRLSIQEDRASNFLRVIGQMVKELFQIVRELRTIEERLVPYEDWERTENGKKVHSKSADATLKGVFADFAENKGGQMQPGSLYHLSQTVGYSSLPDLFFNTHIYDKDNVDKVIDQMNSFNPNVRNVLKRKLYQFIIWKEKTHKELTSRRTFLIRYLRQHWATIKMYMAWTKPYLKHIRRLSMNENQMDSPDLISAFETSMTEIEILAKKPAGGGQNRCILANFTFNTRPIMQYRQEYQQGPVHVGRVTITLRSYGWGEEEIRNYKRMRDAEDKQLLSLVDESVASAMDELGEDLERYINDKEMGVFDHDIHDKFGAKEPTKKKKEKPVREPVAPLWEPFTAIFWGFADMVKTFLPLPGPRAEKIDTKGQDDAAKAATNDMFLAYKFYKKSHGMLTW